MGNLLTVNKNIIRQKTVADFTQTAGVTCEATCTNISSGNVTIIENSTVGDVDFTQECAANAECVIDNSFQVILDVLQEAKQLNQTEASLGGGVNGVTIQLNETDEEIRTSLNQAFEALCSADATNIRQGNLVYVTNSNTGDLGFAQTGNSRAACVVSNLAVADFNLKQKATQENRAIAAAGIVGLIIAIIVIIIIIGAIRGAMKMKQSGSGFAALAGGAPPSGGGAPAARPQISSQNTAALNSALSSALSSRGGGSKRFL